VVKEYEWDRCNQSPFLREHDRLESPLLEIRWTMEWSFSNGRCSGYNNYIDIKV